jgi:outer membrane lipoprotein-sorting protein
MKPASFLLAVFVATSGLTLAHSQPVSAAEDAVTKGGSILRVVDDRAARFPDQTYTATMEIFKRGESEASSKMVFSMSMKNLEKQLITFTDPGDVAGMKILMEDRDTIYMYSPEFKKVRRVAAHMQNQGFLGSEFTAEDMVMSKLSPGFDAELVGKKGTETQLNLKPKAGITSSFSKLELFIDSAVGGVTRIHYFDGAGNHVRTQVREAWTKFEDTQIPTKIRMKNVKTKDETVITLTGIDVKTAVPDDLFSRRTLMRG